MSAKPCLSCGGLTTTGNRHPWCRQAHERQRQRRKRIVRPYTWTEQQRRAKAVTDWVDTNGWLCPGYNRAPHESDDLTADHVHAVAAGGPEAGRLQVLCRSCNSAKRDHP